MAISIKDLFKYKAKVEIKDNKGVVVKTVWVRLLGDRELEQAGKMARIASTSLRRKLRDPNDIEYQDRIMPVEDLSRDEIEQMIVEARRSRITQEAYVQIDKEELPKIEEIAEEPDAPSLEEQEQFDDLIEKQQKDYEEKVDQYIEGRLEEIRSDLKTKTDEEILDEAKTQMSNILPLQEYFSEFTAYKVFMGTFEDELCKIRSFDSVDDFKDSESSVRDQLVVEYTKLEIAPDEIKNS